MSLAEVVVFTVGNRVGCGREQDRAVPANTAVALAVPATALPAACGEGPHSRGSLDPVPRSSKLTVVNWVCAEGGRRDTRRGRMRTPLSPGPPGLRMMTPRLWLTGCSITPRRTVPSVGWR